MSLITIGEPEIAPLALNFQRTSPVAASNAYIVPLYEPAKTRSCHTAGEA